MSRWDDSVWTVEITEERETPPSSVGELTFPGEEPLVIEWPETGKEEVLCGSSATLKVLSPGDRTYTGLYTIEAGRIGLRVKRDGELYWMGTLDPEFYEEPYCDTEDYEVMLTFSDFGILERLQYGLDGLQTVGAIVEDALNRGGLGELLLRDGQALGLASGWISSSIPGEVNVNLLSGVSVRSDNFTDEDGEVSNLRDVVEGVLQPLGLRMVQRGGRVWVYDLNGIHGEGTVRALRWHGKDQVLGVDRVANSVKVTFSPYGGSEVQCSEVSYLGSVDREDHRYDGSDYPIPDEVTSFSFGFTDGETSSDDLCFTIFTSGDGSDGVGASLGSHARYFHMEPLYGGKECDGIVWGFTARLGQFPGNQAVNALFERAGDEYYDSGGRYRPWEPVLRTYRVWLPCMDEVAARRYQLRLRLESLLDLRVNPFEDFGDYNSGGYREWLQEELQMVRVPVGVRLYDLKSGGQVTYHWENPNMGRLGRDLLDVSLGHWVAGDYSGPLADGQWTGWLEWYSPEGGSGSAPCEGWSTNRQAVSPYSAGRAGMADYDALPLKVRKLSDGQFLEYPSSGGWLEVTVYSTVECYDDSGGSLSGLFRERLRWQLYKSPQVELVWSDTRETVDTDDIEYKGVINALARDEVTIETTCGTPASSLPTARGAYYRTSDGKQLEQLERGGRTDTCEHLLIGTLHSQFASRHVRLSGTTDLLTGGLALYREACQGSRLFLVTEDVQDVDAGTSEAVLVELSGDEYERR